MYLKACMYVNIILLTNNMLNRVANYSFCVSFLAPFQNTAATTIKKSNAFIKK